MPQAQLLEYGGEPHGLLATCADRLKADLLAFLQGHDVEAETRQEVIDTLTAEAMLRQPVL